MDILATQRLVALGFSSYGDYLKSALWSGTRRRLALPQICIVCRSKKRLQHHHRSYENLGCEQRDDIVVLCNRCHGGTHDHLRKFGGDLRDAHVRYEFYRKANQPPKKKLSSTPRPETKRRRRGKNYKSTGRYRAD